MADETWGHAFLRRCGIDPDDPSGLRRAYESCHEGYKEWLLTGRGEMDHEAFGMLVDAILAVHGRMSLPLDWLALRLSVLPPQGPRNGLTPGSSLAGQSAGERMAAVLDAVGATVVRVIEDENARTRHPGDTQDG